jgi:hypothetical protein
VGLAAPLPFLTEADPDRAQEGSIDPLGLATLADRLADQIAPDVTARMSRIRFLTAIAVGTTITEELGSETASDGRTPAYLAYEWLVVESLARRRPPAQTQSVPGIQKARRVVGRTPSGHLDAGSYLQVPKVFGFHGVYKRLARGLGVVDQDLLLLGAGSELLRTWEREQKWPGFADRTPGSPGGRFARRLWGEVQHALLAARVEAGAGSHLWSHLADSLAPGEIGRRERSLLWSRLIDERKPIRSELLLALRDMPANSETGEAQALRAVAPRAGAELRARIAAIEAFELVAHLLVGTLQAMRVHSTRRGARAVRPRELAGDEAVVRASKELPRAIRRTAELLLPLGEQMAFEQSLGHFAEPLAPLALVEEVLAHHENVQDAKGKRAWLERANDGFYVRGAYRTIDDAPDEDTYIHPYRVYALSSFVYDLGEDR